MRALLSIIPMCLLIGCAGTPRPDAAAPPQAISDRLTPRNLAPGDCGLFVWTAGTQRRFILFSRAETLSGAWMMHGTEQALIITDQSGNSADEQFPTVTYAQQSGGDISLSLTNRETIVDGTRFKAGTLKFEDTDGWERIIPVVGLSVCQPLNAGLN